MESKHPKVGVAIIVPRDGKFLLGKRKNSNGAGMWAFPGGHLEMGEELEQCAARELKEETGMTTAGFRFVGTTNDIFSSEKHYVTFFFLAFEPKGDHEIREPDKCETWEWFPWEALPDDIFLPIVNLKKSGFNPKSI